VLAVGAFDGNLWAGDAELAHWHAEAPGVEQAHPVRLDRPSPA
jgi:hypothetical protein